ncbi:peptide-methionine (S)-S-oxide reductase MsrA [Tenuifilum osseticum]|uniref:peptide-methionine (S)-S-oxide reductase MsrA n=1 Tax=Tenuifilum osseticum TaxID=3374723 RepID=UPI0034E567A0
MKKLTYVLTLSALTLTLMLGCKAQKPVETMSAKTETVTLGAGCFWCVEAIFSRVNGVVKVESGYSGGHVVNPTYQEVCTGNTGHAEVVQVTFNPDIIPFAKILEIYFKTHDPTTLNRQGADIGTQYRSVIFYHNEDQKATAIEIKNQLDAAGIWSSPIVTAIEPFKNFYKAENYHQNYYEGNKNQPYCRMVITPKLEKFEKVFSDYLKK